MTEDDVEESLSCTSRAMKEEEHFTIPGGPTPLNRPELNWPARSYELMIQDTHLPAAPYDCTVLLTTEGTGGVETHMPCWK